MIRLISLSCYQFKNHESFLLPLDTSVMIRGENGSGKTNILEAAYLAINGIAPPNRTTEMLLRYTASDWFVKATYRSDTGATMDTVVSIRSAPVRLGFSIQGINTTRQKMLEKHKKRALIFSPMDMNLVYLGPALRRNFLDEILLLAHPEFTQIRKNYSQILRSRNTLLKQIADKKESIDWLDIWDEMFTKASVEYQGYRDAILAYFLDALPQISKEVRRDTTINASFDSKIHSIIPTDRIHFVRNYLHENRERDILIGHTCIGPHLDDLLLSVTRDDTSSLCADILSRGENKTLLLSLKQVGAKYIQEKTDAEIIYLLDDVGSELDGAHFSTFMQRIEHAPYILAWHAIPKDFNTKNNITEIILQSDAHDNETS